MPIWELIQLNWSSINSTCINLMISLCLFFARTIMNVYKNSLCLKLDVKTLWAFWAYILSNKYCWQPIKQSETEKLLHKVSFVVIARNITMGFIKDVTIWKKNTTSTILLNIWSGIKQSTKTFVVHAKCWLHYVNCCPHHA